jgi:hypothetical protein
MSAIRSLFAQREARGALAVWALIPTLFLFFAVTLAVDPSTQINKVKLGVTVLDAGVQTPQGTMSIGAKLLSGLHGQVPVEVVQFQAESALKAAVLAREVSGGVVFPENMTSNLRAGQPVALRIVKNDGNDPFTNAFMTNISTQLATNLNAALPALLGGKPVQPLVSTADNKVAASTDFRFSTIPAILVLPLWIATLAFSVLLSRAIDKARRASGFGMTEAALVQLGTGAIGAAIVAAVITLDIGLFTWRWDLDFLGLFGFLWLGLAASAWLLQGTIRLLGFELGALAGLLALFFQQPVSGAAFPAAFAPDVVRWFEGFAPLRYVVEGLRNLLIGGSTMPDMTFALAALAGAGLLLFGAGVARMAIVPGRQRTPQPLAQV